ncbi:hypothetical protein ACP275_09G052400 [Erythranthe tilingii]
MVTIIFDFIFPFVYLFLFLIIFLHRYVLSSHPRRSLFSLFAGLFFSHVRVSLSRISTTVCATGIAPRPISFPEFRIYQRPATTTSPLRHHHQYIFFLSLAEIRPYQEPSFTTTPRHNQSLFNSVIFRLSFDDDKP